MAIPGTSRRETPGGWEVLTQRPDPVAGGGGLDYDELFRRLAEAKLSNMNQRGAFSPRGPAVRNAVTVPAQPVTQSYGVPFRPRQQIPRRMGRPSFSGQWMGG